jgi:hypothetical protein
MTSNGSAGQVLADHTLLLAIPAFFPAVIVVGVVVYVAMRDRRTPDDESDGDDLAITKQTNTNEDG